ncbi:uncharacterized protein BT62DRAFT_1008551 [Guyanagaster necrorhizus]|uniref:Uncharacterized protein n=1 Tax=Guyanagaster necrorhizus TaxID=856835 RepID=A0A9P7VNN7_9AGAR|nr:uncharacterized protein BT62DRAFT_1008551 [Guyanagaster necrorhizus MCA 3950]KAG7443873.1 hypothetical protein BT62DRAFT_1008551 [Guyanagaster necrorhizus MCA 3950]
MALHTHYLDIFRLTSEHCRCCIESLPYLESFVSYIVPHSSHHYTWVPAHFSQRWRYGSHQRMRNVGSVEMLAYHIIPDKRNNDSRYLCHSATFTSPLHGSGYNFVSQLETFDVSISEENVRQDMLVGFISPRLVDMVLSRCSKKGRSLLKEVNVDITVRRLDDKLWHMNTDRMQELRQCRENGVSINISVQDREERVWNYA